MHSSLSIIPHIVSPHAFLITGLNSQQYSLVHVYLCCSRSEGGFLCCWSRPHQCHEQWGHPLRAVVWGRQEESFQALHECMCVCVCTPWHWVVRVDRGRLDPSVYATSSHKDECKERTVGTLWGRFNPNITVKRTSSCFISGQLTHDHNLNSEMLTCAFIHTHTLASDHAPPPAVVAVPQHVLLPV